MITKFESAIRLDETLRIPASGLKNYVIALAQRYGVTYKKTPHDDLAEMITYLSDDDIKLDNVQCLLIALKRSGVINKKQMGQLLVNYLREKFHVRPV